MDEPNELIPNLMVIPEIARGADVAGITSRSGNILAQFRKEARGRIANVVERVIAQRVAKLRCQEWPLRFFDRERGFSVCQTVKEETRRNSVKAGRHERQRSRAVAKGPRLAILNCNILPEDRIAWREGELLGDRQPEAQGPACDEIVVK